MPQLSPLMWIFSVLFIVVLFVMMVLLYNLVLVLYEFDFVIVKEKDKWLW